MKLCMNITKEKKEELLKTKPFNEKDGLVKWIDNTTIEVDEENANYIQLFLRNNYIPFSNDRMDWFILTDGVKEKVDCIYASAKEILDRHENIDEDDLSYDEIEMLEKLSDVVDFYEKYVSNQARKHRKPFVI